MMNFFLIFLSSLSDNMRSRTRTMQLQYSKKSGEFNLAQKLLFMNRLEDCSRKCHKDLSGGASRTTKHQSPCFALFPWQDMMLVLIF